MMRSCPSPQRLLSRIAKPGKLSLWENKSEEGSALHRYLASIEGKNLVVTGLIAEVARNYYELLALDNELAILNETIALQENAFELVKVQKEAAMVNTLAVKQFEAQLLNSKGRRVAILQLIIENESEINLLSGRYPGVVQRSSVSFNESIPARISTGLPSDILLHRPDIREAEFELTASRADVKAAKAAFYPSLSINGSIGFQAYKPNLLFFTPESYVYGIIGTLATPVVNRAAIKAEFRRANAQQLEALYNYQKSIVNGYTEVYNHINGIANLETIHAFKTDEVNALTESIETSAELFRTGRATYLEVIVAQQNALLARLELVDIRKQQFISTVNLYKALGGGWR